MTVTSGFFSEWNFRHYHRPYRDRAAGNTPVLLAPFAEPTYPRLYGGAVSMQPSGARTEDLDEVISRFHVWSNSHNEMNKRNEFVDGARELSFEEALESTRRRWQFHMPSPPRSPGKGEQPAVSAAFEDVPVAPDTVKLSTALKPVASTSPAPQEPCQTSFGTVLSETVLPEVSAGLPALVCPPAGKPERQVSMTLRVAASEQALIKARAAEAGLSASAYLRECALEVERLRAQVHHTLALIEQKQNLACSLSAGSPPVPVAAGGFLARLRQLIFGAPVRLTLRA